MEKPKGVDEEPIRRSEERGTKKSDTGSMNEQEC